MTHVCECPSGIFIIVKYIISAHCQPHRGFYNKQMAIKIRARNVIVCIFVISKFDNFSFGPARNYILSYLKNFPVATIPLHKKQ